MTTEEFQLRKRLFGIIDRCYNPNTKSYKHYGAVGVTVCNEWLDNPQQFIDWAMANGYESNLVVDKDILCDELNISPKVYSPQTCQWITASENSRYVNANRVHREVERYTIAGEYIDTFKSCVEAAIAVGVCSSNINRVCNELRMLAGEWQWKFKDSDKLITPYDVNSYRTSKRVAMISLDDQTVVQVFRSAVEATTFLGKTNSSPITAVCNGTILPSGNVRQSAYGYSWKYLD